MFAAYNLISFLLLCLLVWSCVWSHLAFRRWEKREDAKVRALQQIAMKLGNGASKVDGESQHEKGNLPTWAATR